jgi:hypothetical protein
MLLTATKGEDKELVKREFGGDPDRRRCAL